jgi:ribonuclease P protein component
MTGARDQRDRRLPRARRITRGAEIRDIFKRGRRSRTLHLDVLDSDSPLSFVRIGVVVPRYGNTAVDRNRLKRRLREALRCEIVPRLDRKGLARDVLVRARREAYGVDYPDLVSQLERWLEDRWPESS